MAKKKITNTTMKAFERNSSVNQRMSDTELSGFYVKKRKGGTFYYLDYTLSSKRRTVGIGRYPDISADQARILAKKIIGKIADGEDVVQTKEIEKLQLMEERQLTLESYLNNIYQSSLNRKKSGKQTRQAINKHFSKLFNHKINAINAKDILKWQIEMENKNLSYTRILSVFNMLKTMLNHAVKNGFIDAHQLTNVKLEKPLISQEEIYASNSKRGYLSKSQIQAFFNAIEQYQEIKRNQRRNSRQHGRDYLPDLDQVEFVDHVKPWLLFMFFTGFRPGDIFGLRWEHINFHNKTVRKIIEKTAHQCPEPKTFPIAEPLLEILIKWKKQQGNPETGLVFINPATQQRFDKKAMQKPWKKIRKLAGLPENLQMYTLRHNFPSHMIINGADLLSVSKLMGHQNIQTTIQHYAHLQPNRNKTLVDEFAQMVSL